MVWSWLGCVPEAAADAVPETRVFTQPRRLYRHPNDRHRSIRGVRPHPHHRGASRHLMPQHAIRATPDRVHRPAGGDDRLARRNCGPTEYCRCSRCHVSLYVSGTIPSTRQPSHIVALRQPISLCLFCIPPERWLARYFVHHKPCQPLHTILALRIAIHGSPVSCIKNAHKTNRG